MDDLTFAASWCIRIVVCSTIVSALGVFAMFFTRKQYAAHRHFCGALMCAVLLLTPALCFFVPGRSLSWKVAGEAVAYAGGAQMSQGEAPRTREVANARRPSRAEPVSVPTADSPTIQASTSQAPPSELGGHQSNLATLSPGDEIVQKSRLAASKATVTTVLLVAGVAIYWFGCMILLTRLMYSHLAIWKIRRGPLSELSPQLAAELQPRFAAYQDRISIDGSGRVNVPIVVGLVRPYIILPRIFCDWHAGKRNAVLAHELTHIERNDPLAHLLAQLACCFYWANPLLHIATKDMHRSQEIACDQQAAMDCCDNLVYARWLVEIADDLRHPNQPPNGALAMSHSDLEKRVSIVLATKLGDVRKWKKRWSLRLLVLAGLMAAALVFDPSADPISSRLMAQSSGGPQALANSIGESAGDEAQPVQQTSEQESRTEKNASQKPAVGSDSVDQGLRKVVVSGQVVSAQGRAVPQTLIYLDSVIGDGIQASTSGLVRESGDFQIEYTFPDRGIRLFHAWFYSKGHGIRVAALSGVAHYEATRVEGVSIPLPKYDECRFRVVAPDGTPCVGATLTPYYIAVPNGMMIADEPTGLFAFLPSELRSVVDSQTDSGGEGTVRAIPAQLLDRVAVESEEYGRQIFRRVVGEAEELQVLQLKEVGTIKGTILIEDPTQLAGLKFHLRSDSTYSTAEVDELGQFELSGPVDPNARIETAWDTELDVVPSIEHRLPIRGGETRQMTVDTVPAVTVHGQVLTSDTGVPVAGARISLRRTKSLLGWSVYVTTDREGRYTAKVAPGLLKQQLFAFRMSQKAAN